MTEQNASTKPRAAKAARFTKKQWRAEFAKGEYDRLFPQAAPSTPRRSYRTAYRWGRRDGVSDPHKAAMAYCAGLFGMRQFREGR